MSKHRKSPFRQQLVVRTLVSLVAIFAFTATTLTKDRTLELEKGDYIVKERVEGITTILKNNPNIDSVKVRRDDEVFANYPNIEKDKMTYFFDVEIKRRLCDSDLPEYSFVVFDKGPTSLLRAGGVSFECTLYEGNADPNALDTQFKPEVDSVFKSEVLDKLSVDAPRKSPPPPRLQ